eukprot:COSAG04_NODE_3456_length_2799_cov_3.252222_2_plen_148_part_00
MLRIGFLECEDLGEYLSRPLYENYGGYYKMNCGRTPTRSAGSGCLRCSLLGVRAADVFDYVAKLPASSLAAHGVSDPLPQQVRVEFDRYFCKAGQFPRPEELSRYDGFYITGSLAGVYDDEPWIKQLDSWTANAIRSGHKVRTVHSF